jgi:Leucine-rich repeat (LRR) protein
MKAMQKRFVKYRVSYNPTLHINYIDYITNARKLEEIDFMENFISNILTKREQKYLIPVK